MIQAFWKQNLSSNYYLCTYTCIHRYSDTKMTSVKLHPQLDEEGPSTFRLAHMEEGLKFLEQEVANYTRCKRKYNFCYNTLCYMNTSSAILAAGCSVSGLVLLTLGPGAIVSLPLMGIGLAGELFATGLGIANKKNY